jgi:alkylated DNA repair dioxygenase AlkB
MDLFGANASHNLLPQNGEVFCHGVIFPEEESATLLAAFLREIPWSQDETAMFGKRIVTRRKVAWFADDGRPYSYSGTVKTAHPWTEDLLRIKALSEKLTGASYNSCLLNLYHDGSEGMGWHSDDEPSIVRESAIASLSFGAERKFSFKHKSTKETVSLVLENGSLLVMMGATQRHWLHQIPKSAKISSPRVNLTFRKMA